MINVTIMNFISNFGPLIVIVEVQALINLKNFSILYTNTSLVPKIPLFVLQNSHLYLSEIYIPFFNGKAIFTIEFNCNITIEKLFVSNVNSKMQDKGCLLLMYSDSLLLIRNSKFFNFGSNTTLIFVFMSTLYLEETDFKSILKRSNINYDVSGIFLQNSIFSMNKSTVIDYNYQFMYFDSSTATISFSNFTFVNLIKGQILFGAATVESYRTVSLVFQTCFFINLTNSNFGSVF